MLEKWKTAADDKWKQRAKIHLGICGGGGGVTSKGSFSTPVV